MDPRDPILQLASRPRADHIGLVPACLGAVCAHLGLLLVIGGTPTAPIRRPSNAVTEIVDVEPEPVPAPPPEPKPAPPEISAPSAPAMREPARAAAAATLPALAAAVLTRAPDPNEPVDLTGDGIVTGSNTSYAGGLAASTGANRNASSQGPSTGASTASSPSRGESSSQLDLSRAASILGGAAWACPFPSEADIDAINNAAVTIRVDVESTGVVRSVSILDDPGHGFAREARRCAMSKKWSPTLDRNGTPKQGTVTLRVRFDR